MRDKYPIEIELEITLDGEPAEPAVGIMHSSCWVETALWNGEDVSHLLSEAQEKELIEMWCEDNKPD